MKAFGFSIVALCLAGCASDVSQEEIERAEHQPYDDQLEVAVTEQALGAVQTIAQVCTGGCGTPIAMESWPHAAVVTAPSGDTILQVVVGTGETSALDTNRQIQYLVAASDQTLYYSYKSASTYHRVVRVTSNGSQTWIFDSVGPLRDLMVDATNLYFVDDRGLRKQPRAGGAGQTLVPAASVSGLLAVDSQRLYFKGNPQTQLRQIEIDGTRNVLMKDVPALSLNFVTQDASAFYYSIGSDVVRVQKKSPFQATAMNADVTQVVGMAAKDGVLYLVDYSVWDGQTLVLKKTTGGRATAVGGVLPGVGSLRIVGNDLYWLQQTNAGDPTTMMRAPL